MASIPKSSQKSWLVVAKRTLSQTRPGLTWDDFARLASIDPRAFKTYRMPENSDDYRTMSPLTRAAIENLLAKESGIEVAPDLPDNSAAQAGNSLLIPSLAALVVRQAHLSLIQGRMVAGVSRNNGIPVGLSREDRRAMGLVSRACLVSGLPDRAAEIHDLLACCTQPLGSWLNVPEVTESGLGCTSLIHAEEGIPTAEAEELASGFSGMTAGLEEQLFAKFMEVIGRFPEEAGNGYYTQIREFVVRHAVCSAEEIKQIGNDLPSILWMVLQQQFYEPVPMSWAVGDGVPICDHCGNAMKQGKAGLVCRTSACQASSSASTSKSIPASRLLRVSRGIRQYWVEPGIDEIRLYDALVPKGIATVLYPFRDRVDISVRNIGIDLKTYASPETLGLKFKKGIGGLAYYDERWVVVPDWQIVSVPSYLDRLRKAMGRPDVRCLSVSEAIKRVVEVSSNA